MLIDGVPPNVNKPSGLFSQVDEGGSGNAGKLTIDTEKIAVTNGGQISTAARSIGNGGDLIINANKSILLSGTAENATLISGQSGIFVSAEPAFSDQTTGEIIVSKGNSGNLEINTNQLIVEEGAKISADTFGTGKAGNVTLNVNDLIVRNGGLIRAASLVEDNSLNPDNTRGDGGNLTINNAESVIITGTVKIGDSPVNSVLSTATEGTGKAGNLTVNTNNLSIDNKGSIESNTSFNSVGNAGNIIINSELVNISNQGKIAVNSAGNGIGGNVSLKANNLILNQGQITAETNNTNGGNQKW